MERRIQIRMFQSRASQRPAFTRVSTRAKSRHRGDRAPDDAATASAQPTTSASIAAPQVPGSSRAAREAQLLPDDLLPGHEWQLDVSDSASQPARRAEWHPPDGSPSAVSAAWAKLVSAELARDAKTGISVVIERAAASTAAILTRIASSFPRRHECLASQFIEPIRSKSLWRR